MLSYQHAYHAGNAADVMKHVALVLLLRRLERKEAPYCYVDAHAGRGLYDLAAPEAEKTREAERGILRLAAAPGAGAAVRDYLDLVAGFNEPGALRYYPGSAALAKALLRAEDRAVLLELHPQELAALRKFVGKDRRIAVHARDCYEGLPALLPPPIRRGLVLLDPSYEVKTEYTGVVELLGKALARFGNGIYLLWYPILAEMRHRALLDALAAAAPPKTLVAEHGFASAATGLGGSGLVIVNTPWQFDDELAEAMRQIVAALDPGGRYTQRWLSKEGRGRTRRSHAP